MAELFDKFFQHGGWLGILAALALAVAYVKERQVIGLQKQLGDERTARIREAKETALLLHQLLPNISSRKPIVSIHDDDDEVSAVIDVRDKLQEQVKRELDSDVNDLVQRYLRNED